MRRRGSGVGVGCSAPRPTAAPPQPAAGDRAQQRRRGGVRGERAVPVKGDARRGESVHAGTEPHGDARRRAVRGKDAPTLAAAARRSAPALHRRGAVTPQRQGRRQCMTRRRRRRRRRRDDTRRRHVIYITPGVLSLAG